MRATVVRGGEALESAGAALVFSIHVAALYFEPIGVVLHTMPVSPAHWALLIGLALSIAVAMELHKLSWRLRRGHS